VYLEKGTHREVVVEAIYPGKARLKSTLRESNIKAVWRYEDV
jgi:hypothetical protein